MIDDARRRFLRGRTTPTPQVVVSVQCLSQRGVECRLCGDSCEPRALRFAPAAGGVAQLVVDAALCTGCGDCVPMCPVAAISIR